MLRRQLHFNKTKNLYRTFVYLTVKRLLDVLVSLLLIIISIPIACIIYWKTVKREGGPIFVNQVHTGKNGKPFKRIQFRTHTRGSDVIRSFPPQPVSQAWEKGVPDNVTFTGGMTGLLSQSGILLGKYHLQHIPELLHVLTGSMSLVGPRPELVEIAVHYNKNQRRRLLTRPGITGLAQLKGYTHRQHKKMLEEDLLYVDKLSIWLDVKIIWKTLVHYPNRYQRKPGTLSWHDHSIGE